MRQLYNIYALFVNNVKQLILGKCSELGYSVGANLVFALLTKRYAQRANTRFAPTEYPNSYDCGEEIEIVEDEEQRTSLAISLSSLVNHCPIDLGTIILTIDGYCSMGSVGASH